MTSSLKYAVGLDMAKNKFDACLASIDEAQKVTIKSSKSGISNTAKGFDELKAWIQKHFTPGIPVVFCLEATGIYYEPLAWYLHQQGDYVAVLLPNKARHYIQSLGIKSKNDKIDAKGLAIMAAQQQLKRWQPLSNQIYRLRQLTRFYQQLQESRTSFRNQLQALEYSRLHNEAVTDPLKEIVSSMEVQIKEISKAIEEALRLDPVLWEKVCNIATIKGLGTISIATVIAETNGFELFENYAQLVSYSGYDIVQNQSGKRVGKTRISKKGNNHIRRILFMPAFGVVRFKVTPFFNLYNRVYERTRLKMKAYTAVQRKLLILIYTLWKKNEAFRPDFHPETQARLLSFH
jgi:transposase